MSRRFAVVRSVPLLRSRVFSVERRTVSDESSTFERDVVTHQGAVAVVAVNDAGEVGIICQYRTPFDDVTWEIPAGTLDVPGEDALTAAQRELREELGCSGARWTLLGRFMVSPGWTDQVMTIYEARELTMVDRHPEGPEEGAATVHWLSLEQLRATFRDAAAFDATAALGLQWVFGNVLGHD